MRPSNDLSARRLTPAPSTKSFRLYNGKSFQVKKGDRLGCAALIPTIGVPNWKDMDQVQQEYSGDALHQQRWPSML